MRNLFKTMVATATAGTLCAKTDKNSEYDFYVFMVLVFKTSLYNDAKGKKNKSAFELFLNAIGAEKSSENIYKCTTRVNLLCSYTKN